jgi:hypothetical protein
MDVDLTQNKVKWWARVNTVKLFFHETREIFLITDVILHCQEELGSTELVSYLATSVFLVMISITGQVKVLLCKGKKVFSDKKGFMSWSSAGNFSLCFKAWRNSEFTENLTELVN